MGRVNEKNGLKNLPSQRCHQASTPEPITAILLCLKVHWDDAVYTLLLNPYLELMPARGLLNLVLE